MPIKFTPGKDLAIADALSRAFLPQLPDNELNLESQVHMVLNNLPISDQMLRTFQIETSNDQVLQKVKDTTRNGWPDTKAGLPQDITTFFQFHNEISEANGILMTGEQVIAPSTLRKDMKGRIHEGHLGIEKCKTRARQALFCPVKTTRLQCTEQVIKPPNY